MTPNTRVVLAVVQVFGIDAVAAEFQGGGEDGGIPVGTPVAFLDPQGGAEDGFGDGLDRVGWVRLSRLNIATDLSKPQEQAGRRALGFRVASPPPVQGSSRPRVETPA